MFRLELITDNFGSDTGWEINVTGSLTIIAQNTSYRYTSNSNFTESTCLKKGGNYTFEILDRYNDGMCCDQGNGSYEGFLDDIPITNLNGGDFNTTETVVFTTTAPTQSPTPEPTPMPTPEPTKSPTDGMCEDNPKFRYKGKKKRKCSWIRNKGRQKRKKLCKKNEEDKDGNRLKIHKWCPTTCATVNLGECK